MPKWYHHVFILISIQSIIHSPLVSMSFRYIKQITFPTFYRLSLKTFNELTFFDIVFISFFLLQFFPTPFLGSLDWNWIHPIQFNLHVRIYSNIIPKVNEIMFAWLCGFVYNVPMSVGVFVCVCVRVFQNERNVKKLPQQKFDRLIIGWLNITNYYSCS